MENKQDMVNSFLKRFSFKKVIKTFKEDEGLTEIEILHKSRKMRQGRPGLEDQTFVIDEAEPEKKLDLLKDKISGIIDELMECVMQYKGFLGSRNKRYDFFISYKNFEFKPIDISKLPCFKGVKKLRIRTIRGRDLFQIDSTLTKVADKGLYKCLSQRVQLIILYYLQRVEINKGILPCHALNFKWLDTVPTYLLFNPFFVLGLYLRLMSKLIPKQMFRGIYIVFLFMFEDQADNNPNCKEFFRSFIDLNPFFIYGEEQADYQISLDMLEGFLNRAYILTGIKDKEKLNLINEFPKGFFTTFLLQKGQILHSFAQFGKLLLKYDEFRHRQDVSN